MYLNYYFSPSPPKEPEKEAEWFEEKTDVVHLTDSTFDEYIANNPSVLVMFYAPCKFKLGISVSGCIFDQFISKTRLF